MNEEITEAWRNCLEAAQRYGSYVGALSGVKADIEASSNGSSSGNNVIVGETNYDNSPSDTDMATSILQEMYRNMNEHGGATSSTSRERKNWLSKRNLELGEKLKQYGINAYRSTDKEDYGTWYADPSKSELLFEKYANLLKRYHTGGIVGDSPTGKQNEVMAILEKGEAVLDKKKEKGLYRMIDFVTNLSKKFEAAAKSLDMAYVLENQRKPMNTGTNTIENVSNSKSFDIHFGDTYIYGANNDTVEKHREVTRQFANDLLDHLNIKR